MKDGIHLWRSEENGEFYTQTWSKGRELHRSSETYKKREGALSAMCATGKLFNADLTDFEYFDHSKKGFRDNPRVEHYWHRGSHR